MEEFDNESISFVAVYIEQVLQEIKASFAKKIDVNVNEVQDISASYVEITDEKMRKILKELLFSKVESETAASTYIDNYYLALQNGDNGVARRKLRILLVLYYTALYFDNVEILMQLLKDGVKFGDDPDDLLLCVLDKNVSKIFKSENYSNIIKRGNVFLESCYKSIASESYVKKEKYMAKLARILERREDFCCKPSEKSPWFSFFQTPKKQDDYADDSKLFTKDKLDIFDEETYMLATYDQLKIVIGNTSKFEKTNNIRKLNSLVQNEGYCSPSVKYGDFLFNIFTFEELIELPEKAADNFMNYGKDLEIILRVKELYLKKTSLGSFGVLFNKNFLNTFSDEEILSFSTEILSAFDNNERYYFDDRMFDSVQRNNHIRECLSEFSCNLVRLSNKKVGTKEKVRALLGMDKR